MSEPLTPWVDLYTVLKIYAPGLIDPATGEITGSPEEIALWQGCVDSATWMLWALAGGKVHASECWIEEYSLVGSCEVILLNAPLATVQRVELVDSCPHQYHGTPLEFCVDFQRVNFCCSSGVSASGDYGEVPRFGPGAGGYGIYGTGRCGCHDRWVKIYYQTESTLPPGTPGRVAWFADQCHKAATGDSSCSLPERISSITRQGVSWSMLDPMDFLDKKLTGVGRLDSWLSTVRLQYPSATLIDPLRSQRRSSKRVDCCGPDYLPPQVNPLDDYATV